MRVLFVVTGFGFGDSIRSDCIIDELLRSKKNKVMILGYDFSYKYFKNKYKTLKITGYNFPDYGMEFKTGKFLLKNIHLPSSWFLNSAMHVAQIKKFKPDIVVSDFEPVANLIAKKLNIKSVSIFGYDPNEFKKIKNISQNVKLQAKYIESIYKNSDHVIIPTYNIKRDTGNIKYVNPIIRKVKKRALKKLRSPFIVMLGGSDYGIELAKKIQKIPINREFVFFGGKQKIGKTHFVGYHDKYLDYLAVCKGVISLAGRLGLSEGLAYKKPMLVFPIRNHIEQLLNAESVKKYAYVVKDKYVEKHVIKFIKNISKYKKMVNKSNIIFNGAEQAVKILKEVI